MRSLFADAHAIEPALEPLIDAPAEVFERGDAMDIVASMIPAGAVVVPCARVVVGWTMRNSGTVPWVGRQVVRVGAAAGIRVISGERACPVPDTAPGKIAAVAFEVEMPKLAGTVAAHWRMANRNGDYCFPTSERFVVTAVVQ